MIIQYCLEQSVSVKEKKTRLVFPIKELYSRPASLTLNILLSTPPPYHNWKVWICWLAALTLTIWTPAHRKYRIVPSRCAHDWMIHQLNYHMTEQSSNYSYNKYCIQTVTCLISQVQHSFQTEECLKPLGVINNVFWIQA